MQTPWPHSRINLVELKVQLGKKLGPEGSKHYFFYLTKFLSSKMSKTEFNRICLRILGRENIALHNQLIRSILKNGISSKASPPSFIQKDEISSHGKGTTAKDAYLEKVSQNVAVQASCSPGLSNGVGMLPPSPRKARTTGNRDRRPGDHRSALGSNGKTSFITETSAAIQPCTSILKSENGDMDLPEDVRTPQQSDKEVETHSSQASEMPDMRLFEHSTPSCSKEQSQFLGRKEGSARNPLGIQFYRFRINRSQRSLASSSRCTVSDGVLWDSQRLKDQMEQIAVANGLDGVSLDSAILLNHSLDSYLKGILNSCTQLLRSRSLHNMMKNCILKRQSSAETETPQISLQDLRLAMELDPQKLGEDWPLLLEKLYTHSF